MEVTEKMAKRVTSVGHKAHTHLVLAQGHTDLSVRQRVPLRTVTLQTFASHRLPPSRLPATAPEARNPAYRSVRGAWALS